VNSSLDDLLGPGVHVIDGGLSTDLEQHGADLSGDLWTARLLADDPDVIVASHRRYIQAGASVVITASYQASRRGFAAAGLDEHAADRLLGRSVELARQARELEGRPDVRVAASVGPYGAVLAGGEEYRGRYGLSIGQLADFHRVRLDVLAAAEPDLLAIETIPDVDELLALADACRDVDLPAWVSLTCPDAGHDAAGDPIGDAFAAAAEIPGVVAVGVNCTAPHLVTDLLRQLPSGHLPAVVYPNAGQEWDSAAGVWRGAADPTPAAADVADWVDAGARLIGGCCGVDAPAIGRLATIVRDLGLGD
jgi:homocysteine S-methyltransferase